MVSRILSVTTIYNIETVREKYILKITENIDNEKVRYKLSVYFIKTINKINNISMEKLQYVNASTVQRKIRNRKVFCLWGGGVNQYLYFLGLGSTVKTSFKKM